MTHMRFGAFLAPHHPIGEHPTLQIRRDLELAEHLDRPRLRRVLVRRAPLRRLGDDRLAGDVPRRRRREHPAHHARHGRRLAAVPPPLQRRPAHRAARPPDPRPRHARRRPGRAAVRRPHARHPPLPSSATAWTRRSASSSGCSTRTSRSRYKSDWFELRRRAAPDQAAAGADPMVAASTISPAGMKAAGKYGIGVISIAQRLRRGPGSALPTQWALRRDRTPPSTANASTARSGGSTRTGTSRRLASRRSTRSPTASSAGTTSTTSTSSAGRTRRASTTARAMATADDRDRRRHDRHARTTRSQRSRDLQKVSGGFGTLIGFAHDWAPREAQLRSFEMFARYVIPRVNGMIAPVQRSADFVSENKGTAHGGRRPGRARAPSASTTPRTPARIRRRRPRTSRLATSTGHRPSPPHDRAVSPPGCPSSLPGRSARNARPRPRHRVRPASPAR